MQERLNFDNLYYMLQMWFKGIIDGLLQKVTAELRTEYSGSAKQHWNETEHWQRLQVST